MYKKSVYIVYVDNVNSFCHLLFTFQNAISAKPNHNCFSVAISLFAFFFLFDYFLNKLVKIKILLHKFEIKFRLEEFCNSIIFFPFVL